VNVNPNVPRKVLSEHSCSSAATAAVDTLQSDAISSRVLAFMGFLLDDVITSARFSDGTVLDGYARKDAKRVKAAECHS
jgi:hypothetical protein